MSIGKRNKINRDEKKSKSKEKRREGGEGNKCRQASTSARVLQYSCLCWMVSVSVTVGHSAKIQKSLSAFGKKAYANFLICAVTFSFSLSFSCSFSLSFLHFIILALNFVSIAGPSFIYGLTLLR